MHEQLGLRDKRLIAHRSLPAPSLAPTLLPPRTARPIAARLDRMAETVVWAYPATDTLSQAGRASRRAPDLHPTMVSRRSRLSGAVVKEIYDALVTPGSCALTLWILRIDAYATYVGAGAAPAAQCGLWRALMCFSSIMRSDAPHKLYTAILYVATSRLSIESIAFFQRSPASFIYCCARRSGTVGGGRRFVD